jgi:thiamine transporter ThiT
MRRYTMFRNKHVLWLTQTAVFTALAIVLQFAAAQFGNQIVTGSVVNFMLIISTVLCGFPTGATISFVAPIVIRLIGVGPPFYQLVPFIALGNLTLVAVWFLFARACQARERKKRYLYPAALILAALCKFAVLYAGVVMFAGQVLLKLPPNSPIMLAYSFPQLITATVGGVLAIAALPLLERAVKPRKPNVAR